jgi:hypothetical protein
LPSSFHAGKDVAEEERKHGAFLASAAKWSLRIVVAVDSNARAFLGFPLSREVTALLFKAATLVAGIIDMARKLGKGFSKL